LHRTTDLFDDPHEFMAEDITMFDGRDIAVDEMEVGTADRRRGHAHDCIGRRENFRIGDVVDA